MNRARARECIEVIEALLTLAAGRGSGYDAWVGKAEELLRDLEQDIAESTPVERGGAS